jgi:hypothetical protein
MDIFVAPRALIEAARMQRCKDAKTLRTCMAASAWQCQLQWLSLFVPLAYEN